MPQLRLRPIRRPSSVVADKQAQTRLGECTPDDDVVTDRSEELELTELGSSLVRIELFAHRRHELELVGLDQPDRPIEEPDPKSTVLVNQHRRHHPIL